MTDRRLVLVINSGSSSLKYQLLDPASGSTQTRGIVERIGGVARLRHTVGDRTHEADVDCADHGSALRVAMEAMAEHGPHLDPDALLAVGHRVVHGGSRFSAPVRIDDAVRAAIAELVPLAPLHNPANLRGIEATLAAFPQVPQVAVFDTAFHHTIPAEAHTYAVPAAWRSEYGVRRYGFHGTSVACVSRRAAELLGLTPEETRLVVLHLGNGCSATAVSGGRSVDTSMGISPLEGLVMGTRSGDVDPALPAYLARVAEVDSAAYDNALNTRSGLLGLAGVSDFREVEERRAAGDSDAALAFDVAVHRIVKYVGAYAAVLGGLGAVVFTGGIGENSAGLRSAVLGRLGGLGVQLDDDANAGARGEARLTTDDSPVAAWVVPTNEELEIARDCAALLR